VQAQRWLYEPDMPDNAPVFRSAKLDELTSLARRWNTGERPTREQLQSWNPNELLCYLQHLPRPLSVADCDWLDSELQLTKRGNYEILVEWLTIAAASDYEPAFQRTREVLAARRAHEVPAAALHGARQASTHPRRGRGDVRAGRTHLPFAVAAHRRELAGEIPGLRVMSCRPPQPASAAPTPPRLERAGARVSALVLGAWRMRF
jgi:hypothetical protein